MAYSQAEKNAAELIKAAMAAIRKGMSKWLLCAGPVRGGGQSLHLLKMKDEIMAAIPNENCLSDSWLGSAS